MAQKFFRSMEKVRSERLSVLASCIHRGFEILFSLYVQLRKRPGTTCIDASSLSFSKSRARDSALVEEIRVQNI